MDKKKEFKSALRVQEGIPQPPSINPDVLNGNGKKEKKEIFS